MDALTKAHLRREQATKRVEGLYRVVWTSLKVFMYRRGNAEFIPVAKGLSDTEAVWFVDQMNHRMRTANEDAIYLYDRQK